MLQTNLLRASGLSSDIIFIDNFDTHLPDFSDAPYTDLTINGGGHDHAIVSNVLETRNIGSFGLSLTIYDNLTFKNGRVRAKVALDATGGTNTRGGIFARQITTIDYLSVYMEYGDQTLHIQAPSYSSSTPMTIVIGTDYYLEIVFNEDVITATAYSDSGYTTVLATKTRTGVSPIYTGKAGMLTNGAVGSGADFDNFEILATG